MVARLVGLGLRFRTGRWAITGATADPFSCQTAHSCVRLTGKTRKRQKPVLQNGSGVDANIASARNSASRLPVTRPADASVDHLTPPRYALPSPSTDAVMSTRPDFSFLHVAPSGPPSRRNRPAAAPRAEGVDDLDHERVVGRVRARGERGGRVHHPQPQEVPHAVDVVRPRIGEPPGQLRVDRLDAQARTCRREVDVEHEAPQRRLDLGIDGDDLAHDAGRVAIVLALLDAVRDVAVGHAPLVFVHRVVHGGRAAAIEFTIAQRLLPSPVGSIDRPTALTAPLVEDRRQHLGPLVVPHHANPTRGLRFMQEASGRLLDLGLDELRSDAVPETPIDHGFWTR